MIKAAIQSIASRASIASMHQTFDPTHPALQACIQDLRQQGWSLLASSAIRSAFSLHDDAATAFIDSWNQLPADEHLADGGRYRFRRHASLLQTFAPDALAAVPYRPHWQPLAYNKLHGGRFRHFAPITDTVAADPLYTRLVAGIGALFRQVHDTNTWHVETHQFRIDASLGRGLPTPEGAHRDGVDFVALLLIQRGTLEGGVTSIHTLDGKTLAQTTLAQPWSLMLLDDNRVAHATTPIEAAGATPVRDTLVITYRQAGFLEPLSP
jgi:hypothetical protein